MDYSAANTQLWGLILQLALLAALLLLAQILRRRVPLVRRSLMPTAVLAGFLGLALRYLGLPLQVDQLEMITYHGLGLGFVALALRTPEPQSEADRQNLTGLKSGALIASCYVIQAIIGLLISLGLAATFMPKLFRASGLLLPMGFGQGPGQANNIGSSYQALGFSGGQSFGLALAACGFLVACLCGVAYLNYLQSKGRISRNHSDESSDDELAVAAFQQPGELPVAESVDRFTINMALVLAVYGCTYLLSLGLTTLAGNGGLGHTVSSLIWGFNFLIGSLLAIATRQLLKGLRKVKLMHRQYQNNYLLSRASGLAFDLMIVAGIASINFSDLSGLWAPFILMSLAGGIGTFFYLKWICRYIYPEYFYEGFFSMFGMMTGTISSGVLLLREVDSQLRTPAANNLLVGSAFAILLGGPMLLLVGLAPNSTGMTWAVLGICLVYFAALLVLMLKARRRQPAA